MGLIKQITSLVLIRKFQTNWLKILLLGGCNHNQVGFIVVLMELSISDSI